MVIVSCLVLQLVWNLKLVPLKGERKHIDIGVGIIVVVMPVNQLHHNILTRNPLVELDVPLYGAQVLVAPQHRVAVHALQAESPLNSLHVGQIDFKGNVYVFLLVQTRYVGA